MAVIKSTADVASKEFRANQAAMRALVAELEAQRAKAAEGGSPQARERHLARGKLLPRERVMTLIDPGTPFLELSPLAANAMYDDAIHGAAGVPRWQQRVVPAVELRCVGQSHGPRERRRLSRHSPE